MTRHQLMNLRPHPRALRRRHLLRRGSRGSDAGSGAALDATVQDISGGLGLGQSQFARRRGSVLAQSTRGPAASSIFQSGIGLDMAQTAVLGDSQGSVAGAGRVSAIAEEDMAADGGVSSALGGSYVDGDRRARASVVQSRQEQDEEAELEDGGVLGMLAQIYGTGVNVKGRGRGPPRAI